MCAQPDATDSPPRLIRLIRRSYWPGKVTPVTPCPPGVSSADGGDGGTDGGDDCTDGGE